MYVFIFLFKSGLPIGRLLGNTDHSAYDMFSTCKFKYQIVNSYSNLAFRSGNFFLIAPFPDNCLLVLFFKSYLNSWHKCYSTYEL